MEQGILLGKIFEFSHIGSTIYENDQRVHPEILADFYPIGDNIRLRHLLMKKADEQQSPVIYEDEFKVLFGCIKKAQSYYFFGPVAAEHMNRVELHQFYFHYGLKKGTERPLSVVHFQRFFAFMQSMSGVLLQEIYPDEIVMKENGLTQADLEEDQYLEKKRQQTILVSEEASHHTYQSERQVLDAVREGHVEEALRLNSRMDSETGIMSKNELSQWRKLVTVAIALTTRAAIEGGVSPAAAYYCSDTYNQLSDDCKTVPELIQCRNQAVRELTTMVNKKQMTQKTSGYVERCCDYINKHYREKIYLDDIADRLGISSSYLSRLFVQEKGVKLQDYIVQLRVDRAVNLLMFSNESLSAIGDYVNFPSQSYFGKVFKKYKGMTPKEYREKFKPVEF